MLKRIIFIVTIYTALTGLALCQTSLWEEGNGSLYSNLKAYKVGDVLTVIIREQSTASSNAKTDTKVKSEISSGPGLGTLDFISLWGLDSENKYKGDAKTQRTGQLSARISVRIVEIFPNGDFRIEGQREVNINGERERISISGVIRSRDIRSDNTIISSHVANAKIMYDGKGPIDTGHEPGILTKLVNWIL